MKFKHFINEESGNEGYQIPSFNKETYKISVNANRFDYHILISNESKTKFFRIYDFNSKNGVDIDVVYKLLAKYLKGRMKGWSESKAIWWDQDGAGILWFMSLLREREEDLIFWTSEDVWSNSEKGYRVFWGGVSFDDFIKRYLDVNQIIQDIDWFLNHVEDFFLIFNALFEEYPESEYVYKDNGDWTLYYEDK